MSTGAGTERQGFAFEVEREGGKVVARIRDDEWGELIAMRGTPDEARRFAFRLIEAACATPTTATER